MTSEVQVLKAHVSINVRDVARSIDFYRRMLGIDPSKVRTGYAKFDVQNPPLNLALNEVPALAGAGALSHMGIQVGSSAVSVMLLAFSVCPAASSRLPVRVWMSIAPVRPPASRMSASAVRSAAPPVSSLNRPPRPGPPVPSSRPASIAPPRSASTSIVPP